MLTDYFQWPLESLTRAAAQLPPIFRNAFLMKALSKVGQLITFAKPITTNFGLSNSFKVSYPDPMDRVLVFGRPEDHVAERGALFSLQALLPSASAFVDIGAHVGYFTYFAKLRCVDKPVYFFEPQPKLFDFIQRAIWDNGLSGVTGFQCGIGREEGEAPFFIHANTTRSSLVKSDDPNAYSDSKIKVTTFDAFVEDCNLGDNLFVKVDIEAGEFDFLEGAQRSLPKISYLVLEVLLPSEKNGLIKTACDRGGFEPYYLCDLNLIHCPQGVYPYHPPHVNWLLCRLKPHELAEKLRYTRLRVTEV